MGRVRTSARVSSGTMTLAKALPALFLVAACAAEAPSHDISKSDIALGKADGITDRFCNEIGAGPGCDLCEELDFYGDGECDGFCNSPDPDCPALFNSWEDAAYVMKSAIEGELWSNRDGHFKYTSEGVRILVSGMSLNQKKALMIHGFPPIGEHLGIYIDIGDTSLSLNTTDTGNHFYGFEAPENCLAFSPSDPMPEGAARLVVGKWVDGTFIPTACALQGTVRGETVSYFGKLTISAIFSDGSQVLDDVETATNIHLN